MDNINKIQQWYLAQCNDLWEHSYGLKIDTLDNPGWALVIDLIGTDLEFKTFETIKCNYEHDNDWLICEVIDKKFKGACGPLLLNEMLRIFNDWSLSFKLDKD